MICPPACPVRQEAVLAQRFASSDPALRRPSAVFLALLALCVVGGWMAWSGSGSSRVAVFVLVVAGWLVSLCLHEYAHARTARSEEHTSELQSSENLVCRLQLEKKK